MTRYGFGLALAVALSVAGCGGSDPTTTVTSPTTATSEAPATTTIVAAGPQPLPASILPPGEYVTTIFEPPVQYRIEQTYPLTAFQTDENTGLQNTLNACINCEAEGTRPHRGIAVHNWWHHFSTEEIIARLNEFETIDFGTPTLTTVAGFPATRIDADIPQVVSLFLNHDGSWWLHAHQRVRFIIVETPAGSMLITISAASDEFDDFLPVAEEILAGISFPDL